MPGKTLALWEDSIEYLKLLFSARVRDLRRMSCAHKGLARAKRRHEGDSSVAAQTRLRFVISNVAFLKRLSLNHRLLLLPPHHHFRHFASDH